MGRFDEIPGGVPTYRNHNAQFWLHDDVMYGRHLPHEPSVTLEDAIETLQKLREMTAGTRVPLMFDARGLSWLNLDARAYIRANAPDVWSQAAIVVKHEFVRLLSHAFLGIAGMDMPLQIFTDEEAAFRYATSQFDAA